MKNPKTMGTVGATAVVGDIGYLGGERRKVVIGGTDYVMTAIGGGMIRRHFNTAEQPSFPITCAASSTVELLGIEADALVTAGFATYA